MDFSATTEENELRSTLRKFFLQEFPTSHAHESPQSKVATRKRFWTELAKLGVEELFNIGGGGQLRELAAISREAGFCLAPDNLEDILLAQFALGSTAEGFKRCVLILAANLESNSLMAIKSLIVPAGSDSVSQLVVLEAGIVGKAKVLDLQAKGVSIEEISAFDLTRPLTRVTYSPEKLNEVALTQSPELLLHVYSLLKVVGALGAAESALELTKRYVTERKQFGVPVGGFQAVQHQVVDMALAVESIGALVEFAIASYYVDPIQFKFAVQSLSLLSRAQLPEVVESAVQVHGGIGFTWEYDLHLYLRRIRALLSRLPDESGAISDIIDSAERHFH